MFMLKKYSTLALSISVAIVSLISSIISPVNAHGVSTGYVNGNEQSPQGRATQVRQTIRFIVPTTDITQIRIVAPEGIKIGNNIALYNDTTRQLLSGVVEHKSGNDIEIDLPQSLAPNTQVTVDLNSVSLWGTDRTYHLYSKSTTISGYTYIGSAEFHRY